MNGGTRNSSALCCLLLVVVTNCIPTPNEPSATGATPVLLPAPDTRGAQPLETVLASRRSVRQFSQHPVTLRQVGQLLWAAQGITGDHDFRAAPSAGALYPLQLYVIASRVNGLTPGIYRYHHAEHQLELQKPDDHAAALSSAGLSQPCLAHAAATIVVFGRYERTASKYGPRAPRYVHIEVGHLGQNILLQASALGLGAVPVGGFDDLAVQQLIGDQSQPLYLIAVGRR